MLRHARKQRHGTLPRRDPRVVLSVPEDDTLPLLLPSSRGPGAHGLAYPGTTSGGTELFHRDLLLCCSISAADCPGSYEAAPRPEPPSGLARDNQGTVKSNQARYGRALHG